MSNKDSLSGKVALITGASRGIGKEIALELGRLGAEVFINYSSSDEKAEEVLNSIKNLGGKAHKLKYDVSKEDSVSLAFEEIIKINGTIDILINNAGITRDGLLMRMKSEQWDDVLNTNLKGVFLCTKYASKFMMKKRSGNIVNISSVVGIIGNPGQANYSPPKLELLDSPKHALKNLLQEV